MPKTKAELQIEQALIRFANSGFPAGKGAYQVPDYAGFDEWFITEAGLGHEEYVNPAYRMVSKPQTDAELLIALSKVREKYRQRFRRGKKKHFNKLKLLEHCYKSLGDRTKAVLEIVESAGDWSSDLDSDLDSCSQHELRARLFAAIDQGAERKAFKLLGRLKKDEHDSGEVEYLEAMCYFKSGEFREAVGWACKVKEGDRDYGVATALLLECYAFLGDHSSLYEVLLNKPRELKCTSFFLTYVLAVLYANSEDADKSILASPPDLDASKFPSEPNDPSIRLMHHYLVRLATEAAEVMMQASVVEGGFSDVSNPLDQRIAGSFPVVRAKQLIGALVLQPTFWEELSQAKLDEMPFLIVRHVYPPTLEPSVDDFKLASQVLYRLYKRSDFVDNIIRSLPGMASGTDAELRNLGYLAWQEARIVGDDDKVGQIEKHIRNWPEFESSRFATAATVESQRLQEGLTSLGGYFYDIAETLLKDARGRGKNWIDAGLVSLAYFRILESELNARIILPLSKSLSYGELKNRMGDLTGKRKQFWSRAIPQYEQVSAGTRPGLELGSMAILFAKLSNAEGADEAIKSEFIAKLREILRPSGIEAIQSGELASIIASDVVGKYRNPAAHCRFVSLDVAEQSRAHVISALRKLGDWVT